MALVLAVLTLTLSAGAAEATGWYLMLPPIDLRVHEGTKMWRLLPAAPLGRWERIAAFDTAQACEDERGLTLHDAKILRKLAALGWRVVEVHDEQRWWFLALEREALSGHRADHAVCVAADDPALR